MKLQLILLSLLVGAASFAAVIFFADRNGYQRCQAEAAAVVDQQMIDDKDALLTLKDDYSIKVEKYEQTKTIIKYITDITGCATTVVPSKRVDRMRDAYRQSETGSQVNRPSGESLAQGP